MGQDDSAICHLLQDTCNSLQDLIVYLLLMTNPSEFTVERADCALCTLQAENRRIVWKTHSRTAVEAEREDGLCKVIEHLLTSFTEPAMPKTCPTWMEHLCGTLWVLFLLFFIISTTLVAILT